jgi:hypothetical protein
VINVFTMSEYRLLSIKHIVTMYVLVSESVSQSVGMFRRANK